MIKKLLFTVKAFSFWGIIFLLILILGFNACFRDIVSIAISLEMNLSAFCLYFLISIIVFPILSFFLASKSGMSFFDSFAIGFPSLLWTPYKGLDIRGLFSIRGLGLDTKGVLEEILVYVRRLFEMILWWIILIFGIHTIYHQGDNAILRAIEGKTIKEKSIVIGAVLGIYIISVFLAYLLERAVLKKWRNMDETPSRKGTKGQQYYNRFHEQIPSSCRACGGPYPECRSSCDLFDE